MRTIKRQVDVVVAGSGPGGATVARQLALAGKRVLLLEKGRHHRLVGTFEVRYDRSTGEQGGFYEGPDNMLVPDQPLALIGLLWSFDGHTRPASSRRLLSSP